MPEDELARRYLAVLELGREPVLPALVPDFPSLKPYADLFLRSPGFFVMFWNSCLQVLCVLAGQLLVGMPAAWAFARYDFRFKKTIFLLYLILLCHAVPGNDGSILSGPGPFQDTGHTSGGYTAWNILIPFLSISWRNSLNRSRNLLEAARIDGGGEWTIFLRIGVPMGFPGIMTALLLDFFEYWNALEQPLTFLKNKQLWPLSLYLPNVTADNASLAFVAGLVTMAPPVLLYLNGRPIWRRGLPHPGTKE